MNDQLHILLVDDNPEDRALVIRELRRNFPNLRINQITDAKHFARALESGQGDLAITDYQLRWSDGLACSGRSRPAGPSVRSSCSPAPAAKRWRSKQ